MTQSFDDIEIDVLVVDDDHDLVKFIELDLAKTQYKVDHAYTIEEALELIDRQKYDCIVLDIVFGEVDR